MLEWEGRGGEAEPGRGRELKNHPLPFLIEPEWFLTRNRGVNNQTLAQPEMSEPPPPPPATLSTSQWRLGEGAECCPPPTPGWGWRVLTGLDPDPPPSPAFSQGALRTRSSGFSSLCPHKGPLCHSLPGNRPPPPPAAHSSPLPPTTHTGTSYSSGFQAEFPKTCWNKGCT